MSNLSQAQCDNCSKIQNNPGWKDKSWIHFERVEIRFSTGKAYITKDLTCLDFCGFKCFKDWIQKYE